MVFWSLRGSYQIGVEAAADLRWWKVAQECQGPLRAQRDQGSSAAQESGTKEAEDGGGLQQSVVSKKPRVWNRGHLIRQVGTLWSLRPKSDI